MSLSQLLILFIKADNMSRTQYKLSPPACIIILCFFIQAALAGKTVFIKYSFDTESMDIFRYTHDIEGEFFVDVGGYDPYYASNTVYLDWHGLTLEAHPERHKLFLLARPDQINLRYAVTNVTGSTVKLVGLNDDSMASIDPTFLEKFGSTKTGKTVDAKTITMSDLCHQFYPVRPKLISVDIEGHGLVALKSNDWDDPKCVPEILTTETLFTPERTKEQEDFLASKGYSLQVNTNLNQIYILNSSLEHYKEKEIRGKKLVESFNIVPWVLIMERMCKVIFTDVTPTFVMFKHLDNRIMPFYVHFARPSERVLSVPDALEYGRMIHETNSDRRMLILHYSPIRTEIFLGTTNFTQRNITVDEFQVVEFTLQLDGKTQLVYVLDHAYTDSVQVRIADHNAKGERTVLCDAEETP